MQEYSQKLLEKYQVTKLKLTKCIADSLYRLFCVNLFKVEIFFFPT